MIEKDKGAIEGVIFDMDGLLIDSEGLSWQAYNAQLKSYGYSISREEFARLFTGHTPVQNSEQMIAMYHLPADPEQLVKERLAWSEPHMEKGVPLKPGARECLEFFQSKGIPMALATSSLEGRMHKLLDRYDILPMFDYIAFKTDDVRGKPAPDLFEKAAAGLHLDPEACLVLEDSMAGIEASHAAGCMTICIPDAIMPDEEERQESLAVLGSLEDVPEFLEKNSLI